MSAPPLPISPVDAAVLAAAYDLLLAERIARAYVDATGLPVRTVLTVDLCTDGAAIVDVRLVVPAALIAAQREVEAEQGGGR